MDMHPTLTLVVYALLIAVAVAIVTYMVLYTRGLRSKKAVLDSKGRVPVSKEEGIAVATLARERKAHGAHAS